MKTRFFVLGVIFSIFSLGASAQINLMYEQGFEAGSTVNYDVTPSSRMVYDTTLYVGGKRSMKLVQAKTEDVVMLTDTIDFTQNLSLRYIALEFDHICNVATNPGGDYNIALIWVKVADQADDRYQQLTGEVHYNTDREDYSTEFMSTAAFNVNSYNEWSDGPINNTKWKHERFDLDDFFANVADNERKLIFKFVLNRRLLAGNVTGTGWWLDNMRVRASRFQMITPRINMVLYPDGIDHPSSRGARVMLDARTDVAQGILNDSVYLMYSVGSDSSMTRLPMAYVGNVTDHTDEHYVHKRYSARIPFYGYDTMMHFYCMVKDASDNHNEATFPESSGAVVDYRCVRGEEKILNTMPMSYNVNGTESGFPFGPYSDTRCEWVVDSATLRGAGYGPGAITSMTLTLGANMQTQSRPLFQLKMRNAPSNYTVPNEDVVPYTKDYMQVVWDSTLTLEQASNGSQITIHFQDTFFYAGKDIIVQTINDGTVDPPAVTLKTMSSQNSKKTKMYMGKDAAFGANAYSDDDMKSSMFTYAKLPATVLEAHLNQPLVYDAGVAALVFPNYETPVITQPTHVDVLLKNFGAAAFNSVVINYMIDDSVSGSYTWSGSLAGFDTTTVTIATGLTLAPGYHRLRAWTSDMLTVGGVQYRDHEPYNNSSKINNPSDTSFIVCAGPLNGVRYIGGPNADYNNIEEFLFSLSRCGVDDSLVVRLSPDSIYPPFKMPVVDGLTAQHYIVFEPIEERAKLLFAGDATNYIVDLTNVNNIRFRNIDFVRRSGTPTNMVALGYESENCRFDDCRFIDSIANPVPALRISAMINSGYADNVIVNRCTFVGGGIGVSISGQAPDLRSTGATVTYCRFSNQYSNAVSVQYMTNVTVENNEMYDVTSNSSYVMLANGCYGNVSIMANKIYTSHGAGALAANGVNGSSSSHAVIANNMVVSADDGNSNQLTTPFNIIGGSWMDVVYNSVKMTAPQRTNIATATFGGGALSNSRFVNNIVACMDEENYAFNYLAANQTSNTIGHNDYYSASSHMNRMSMQWYNNIEQWAAAVPADDASVSVNPTFLNGSLVDLRTFNRFIKGVGIPVSTVMVDMFGTVRDMQSTCPGAFEFVALFHDFEIEALASPEADVCEMPENVELMVRLRNSGSSTFAPSVDSTMTLSYRISGGQTMNHNVTQTIPANDTVTLHTGVMLQLPSNGLWDSVYQFDMWLTCAIDPNQTNDSNSFTVTSRYKQPDAVDYTQNVPYNSATVVKPTTGVTEWPVYNDPAAPKRRSQILWYNSPDDDDYYYRGDSITTNVLRRDSVVYYKQRRMLPVVRITQLQMKTNTAVGLTDPMPSWIKTGNTNFAVQLTNLGDDTAYLSGDTLKTVSGTNNINDKRVIFGDVRIAPGQALVVQFVTGTSPDPVHTLYGGTAVAPASNANVGLVYKHNGVVEDAVAINSVTTETRWTQQGVPSYVWSGAGIANTVATVGGFIRTAFNGNASDWVAASNANRLFIDRIDNRWIRYTDNGCPTAMAEVQLDMLNAPDVDIELTAMPIPSGCGLGMEAVSVALTNYGSQPAVNLTLNYTAGGAVVSETLTQPVPAGGDTVYTFLTPLNMSVMQDSVFNVTIYATQANGDTEQSNDTCHTSGKSRYAPSMPTMESPVESEYGMAATLTHYPATGVAPVWYDSLDNVIDTAHTITTPLLYTNEIVKMAYVAADSVDGRIGFDSQRSGQKAYPSPYQPDYKNLKQQYIYTASELRAMGMDAGDVTSVAFFLDSIWGTADSVVYANFYIAMGMTPDTIFSGTSAWKATEVVYHREDFMITRADVHGWIEHKLDNSFKWDGVSSLVVQVSFERNDRMSTGMETLYTEKENTTLHKNNNNAMDVLGYTGAGTRNKKRPNIKIGYVNYGCIGPKETIQIVMVGMPNYDAKITWPAGTDSLQYNSCGNVAMDVFVENMGALDLSNFALKYAIDGGDYVSHTVTNTVVPGASLTTQLMNIPMTPGRHHVEAVVFVDGDTINTNDTIHRDFVVRFCGRTYTVSSAANADYHTLSEAVDTMNIVGIDGPVTFNLAAETFEEQISLGNVDGASATNGITFVGVSDSTTILKAATTSAANYVFKIDSTANVTIRDICITAQPASGNNGNVLLIKNVGRMTIDRSTVRVKGELDNANASCIVLEGNVNNMTVRDSWIDSGYYSVKSNGNVTSYKNFVFLRNRLTNFFAGGINLQDVTGIDISRNDIIAGLTKSGRGLIGINLKNVDSLFTIQKNHIYLIDQQTGGKQGMYLESVKCNSQQLGYIVNNMISAYGTNAQGVTTPAGIYMKDCEYVNVFYNSMRVYSGTSNKSRAFIAEQTGSGVSGNIQLMNNIVSNFSSYAYFVSSNTIMTSSDYNDYYAPDGVALAKWNNTDCSTLADLQNMNQKDGSSMQAEPYFTDINDLHLVMANLVGKAQYNPDVIDDIDDSIRSQVPPPTIGAHEMTRSTHNMSIVRILTPTRPTDTSNFNSTHMPPNIESDSILVKVEFYNNGSTAESGSTWYAYLEGYESTTTSVTKNLGTVMSGVMKVDSVKIPAPLGVIYTHSIRVVLNCANDNDTSDNQSTQELWLAPAFDIQAFKISVASTGCTLQYTPVTITLRNVGFKPIPAGQPFEIGYHSQAYSPNTSSENNRISIPTMPDTVIETVSFDTPLPIGIDRPMVFDSLGNFYPTDTAIDIQVRIKGWSKLNLDVNDVNDTTASGNAYSQVFNSYYSPEPPIGFDTTLPYGTWGEVRAMQVNTRPVRWYRDSLSTASQYYTNSNYTKSCLWSTTPQYFHDSTYYLQCFSVKQCPSFFSEVHVHVAPQVENDMAVEEVLAPLGQRVYMENDTVRVRIANYGTEVQQNFPITYQVRKKNNLAPVQEVTEICTNLIDVGQSYVFTFDSLIQFENALAGSDYYLRVWTDLANDQVRRNDTIRTKNELRPSNINDTKLDYKFTTYAENRYPLHANSLNSDSMDVVRVSFNEIDVELPALGRSFTNFGAYNGPEYPVLHVTRGTTDSIFVNIANPSEPLERSRGRVAVYIDFNRNGSFDDPGEAVVQSRALFTDSTLRASISIPNSASLGYMKMRVVASIYLATPSPDMDASKGHKVDFLLFVDPSVASTDLALTQIANPRDYLVRDSIPKVISFRMANKGSSAVNGARIHYSFISEDLGDTVSDVFTWTGILMAGRSVLLSLPAHQFPLGTTKVRIWHETPNDTLHGNDTLVYEYHRFHTVYLTMDDDFDSINNWYAPVGYNNYTRNYWQLGTPNKSSAAYFTAYSEPNSWVTDLTSDIKTGIRGNISYLYSPIIDISQIRPDTLSLYLVRNLNNGSETYIEYYSYRNLWERLDLDSINTWYNNVEQHSFTGTRSWSRYYINCNHTKVRGNFNEKLQFRVVYSTPQKESSAANTNFGAGCGIDNIHIVRGQQRIDVGVVDITYPVAPKYGQTIYPEVVVRNFGYDTVRHLQMGYTYYGRNLARMTDIPCLLAPGTVDTFTFNDPFVVANDFPDTFSITAFTNIFSAGDIYRDNDTLKKTYVLAPLGGDIAAVGFIYPLENVVGGDSIAVTMRVRNTGVTPISNATLSFMVGNTVVSEEVDFVELQNQPLATYEYFNYTFRNRFRATMGFMTLTAVAKCDSNEYVYNDTISKRLKGITAITDVAAAAVVVDTSDYNFVRIQLVIENRGARGVNNFEVGFWIDNDTNTKVVDTFYRATPLTALNMTTHLFDVQLPQRPAGYRTVTGYVHSVEDNDRSNDTTSVIERQYVDIEVVKLIVEENSNPDCRVFMHVRNIGNLALVGKTIPMRATINGNDLSYNVIRRIDPGYDAYIEFNRTIPKSPTRNYTGTGRIQNLAADVNPDNNQTSVVVVSNYVEGIPTVNGASFLLGQNYPNPFSGTTTVPFTLPAASDVQLFVMDAMGKIVYTASGFFFEGDNTMTLDLDNFATGIYYYGIVVDGQRQMRKLIVK